MSSLHEISTDQLENRVVVKREALPCRLCLQQASGQIFKDDVNGYPSTSDIWFVSFLSHEEMRRKCVTDRI
jgi:hypothetical protein